MARDGHAIQNCQDAKKMDAVDAARDGGADRGGDCPIGAESINAASADVVQSGKIIIKVGCSAFSFQRCGSKSAGF